MTTLPAGIADGDRRVYIPRLDTWASVIQLKIFKEGLSDFFPTTQVFANTRQQCQVTVQITVQAMDGQIVDLTQDELRTMVHLADFGMPASMLEHKDTLPATMTGWLSCYQKSEWVWREDHVGQVAALWEDIGSLREQGAAVDSTVERVTDAQGRRCVRSRHLPGHLWQEDFLTTMLAELEKTGWPPDEWTEPEAPSPRADGDDADVAPRTPYQDKDISAAPNQVVFHVSTSAGNTARQVMACVTNAAGLVVAHTSSLTEAGREDVDGYGDRNGNFRSAVTIKTVTPPALQPSTSRVGVKDGASTSRLLRHYVSWWDDVGFDESWVTISFNGAEVALSKRSEGLHNRIWQDSGKVDGREWAMYFVASPGATEFYVGPTLAVKLKGTSPWPAEHGYIADYLKSRANGNKITNASPTRWVIGQLSGKQHWQFYNSNNQKSYDSSPSARATIYDIYGNAYSALISIDALAWCAVT